MLDAHMARLQWLNRMLFLLIRLAAAVVVYDVVSALWGSSFRVGFVTTAGEEIVADEDLLFWERASVVGLAALPDLCWIIGLFQLALLSFSLGRGQVFTQSVVRVFQGFAWALLAMGVTETIALPAIGYFLNARGHIAPLADFWSLMLRSGGLNSLLAAVLVVIVATIMRTAIRIEEEVRLTI